MQNLRHQVLTTPLRTSPNPPLSHKYHLTCQHLATLPFFFISNAKSHYRLSPKPNRPLLAGLPNSSLNLLQFTVLSAARVIITKSEFEHITPGLKHPFNGFPTT